MGMYDEVECDYPLPGEPPEFVRKPGHRFQTKDLDCTLAAYQITIDGRLVRLSRKAEGVLLADFHGDLAFYTSNIAGCGPGLYTRNGEDAESVEYVARFADGKLQDIRETEQTRQPALKQKPFAEMYPKPSPEELAEEKARQAESLVGRTMYRLWGGQAEGYSLEIITEGPKEWVGKKANGELELIRRSDRDCLLFDSEAEAKAYRQEGTSVWEEQKREYDEYARRWRAERGIEDEDPAPQQ